MSDEIPNTNGNIGDDGRDQLGRFAKGNKGGPGNPRSRQAKEISDRFNNALYKVFAFEDIFDVLCVLKEKALAGDMIAIRLVIERTGGLPTNSDIAARIEELERLTMEATNPPDSELVGSEN